MKKILLILLLIPILGFSQTKNINSSGSNLAKKVFIDYADSPMIITGGEITNGTNAGTFKVAALSALLRTKDELTGNLIEVSLAEQDNQAVATPDITYIIALNYNSGSPTISLETSSPYNADKRNIPIGQVMRETDNTIHYISGGYDFQDGVRKLHYRAVTLRALKLGKGSAIFYSGTNNFEMETGVTFGGINEFAMTAYNSATTQFTPIYQDAGTGFTEGATSNVIDFEHYDDGTGTLNTVGVSKYGNFWVYKHVDDEDVYVLYGRDSYSLSEAEAALEPTKPTHLSDFGVLIGCITAPQSGGSFANIQMDTDRYFGGTSPNDYDDLINKPGLDEVTDIGATTTNDIEVGKLTSTAGNFTNLTTGYIPYDNGTSLVDSPIFTDGTGVGIGTTSPTEALDVVGKISLNDGGYSVFVGEGAGLNDDASDNRNVGIGYYSLYSNTTGNYNTANGYRSLFSNTTGNYNTANGM